MQWVTKTRIDDSALFSVVTSGDCSKLSQEQKMQYYTSRCDAAGVDPRTAPFQFIRLQGKEVLYALKGATDQLALKHGIRVVITSQVTEAGVRTVTVRAEAKDGRQTDEVGCVPVAGLSGEALGNAYMKAVTKAKRRAILSLCGLGMLDETEVESVKRIEREVTSMEEEPDVPVHDLGALEEVETPTPDGAETAVVRPPAYGVGTKISQPQQKRLFAIATSVGWTTEAMKRALKDKFGMDHSRDILRSDYERVVEFFKKPFVSDGEL